MLDLLIKSIIKMITEDINEMYVNNIFCKILLIFFTTSLYYFYNYNCGFCIYVILELKAVTYDIKNKERLIFFKIYFLFYFEILYRIIHIGCSLISLIIIVLYLVYNFDQSCFTVILF